MVPKLITAEARKLIGRRKFMSFEDDKTVELWRESLPLLSQVPSRIGRDRFSLQNYPDHFFRKFDPKTGFEKWAAVEVSDFHQVPQGMESLTVPAGLYAVFHYVGSSAAGPRVFQCIFEQWLPNSEFILDERPHFEILGERYKNNDSSSEEDFWIPVKARGGDGS